MLAPWHKGKDSSKPVFMALRASKNRGGKTWWITDQLYLELRVLKCSMPLYGFILHICKEACAAFYFILFFLCCFFQLKGKRLLKGGSF